MKQYSVQFKGHPAVIVGAKDEADAIAEAKKVRGLDGIGHEMNNLLGAGSVTLCDEPAVGAPKKGASHAVHTKDEGKKDAAEAK